MSGARAGHVGRPEKEGCWEERGAGLAKYVQMGLEDREPTEPRQLPSCPPCPPPPLPLSGQSVLGWGGGGAQPGAGPPGVGVGKGLSLHPHTALSTCCVHMGRAWGDAQAQRCGSHPKLSPTPSWASLYPSSLDPQSLPPSLDPAPRTSSQLSRIPGVGPSTALLEVCACPNTHV